MPKYNSTDGAKQFAYDSIAKRTGLRATAIKSFVDENGLDLTQLVMDIGQGKLSGTDFATALSGNPGNKYQRAIISKYKLSKSELAESGIRKIVNRMKRSRL